MKPGKGQYTKNKCHKVYKHTQKYFMCRFFPFLFIRGISCPGSVQTSLIQNWLKLPISGFPYNCLPVSCGDIHFLKVILCLVLAWKSGLKASLLPLGPSYPLQTSLLSDLVGCDSPMRIVMAIWWPFFLEAAITTSAGGCHTWLDGQHCPLWKNHGVFARAEKPSEDVNCRFFMNKKGLILKKGKTGL